MSPEEKVCMQRNAARGRHERHHTLSPRHRRIKVIGTAK
jgi:hypothetical protein